MSRLFILPAMGGQDGAGFGAAQGPLTRIHHAGLKPVKAAEANMRAGRAPDIK
jgi:hypothetical protein